MAYEKSILYTAVDTPSPIGTSWSYGIENYLLTGGEDGTGRATVHSTDLIERTITPIGGFSPGLTPGGFSAALVGDKVYEYGAYTSLPAVRIYSPTAVVATRFLVPHPGVSTAQIVAGAYKIHYIQGQLWLFPTLRRSFGDVNPFIRLDQDTFTMTLVDPPMISVGDNSMGDGPFYDNTAEFIYWLKFDSETSFYVTRWRRGTDYWLGNDNWDEQYGTYSFRRNDLSAPTYDGKFYYLRNKIYVIGSELQREPFLRTFDPVTMEVSDPLPLGYTSRPDYWGYVSTLDDVGFGPYVRSTYTGKTYAPGDRPGRDEAWGKECIRVFDPSKSLEPGLMVGKETHYTMKYSQGQGKGHFWHNGGEATDGNLYFIGVGQDAINPAATSYKILKIIPGKRQDKGWKVGAV